MIKRLSLMFLIACILLSSVSVYAFKISYDGICEEYTGRHVTLFVNDKKIESDMPAIILNSRTLVPARAVFEALGAEVLWKEEERQVLVSDASTVVAMTVNSDTAYIDEEKKTLDCPAKIINDRLLIPVRFAAEALGSTVLWDDASASVYISKKAINVKDISSSFSDGKVTVKVSLEASPDDVVDFVLDSDNPRIVVDISGAEISSEIPKKTFDNLSVKAVRCGQYQTNPHIARVVIDLHEVCDYEVVTKDNSVIITVKAEAVSSEEPDNTVKPDSSVSWDESLTLSDAAKDMLVVIDAGHGGEDVGAVGKENGVDVLYEKDVNLAVSQYLNEYLTEAGVKTYMMRSEDVAVSLYDRPVIANNLNADLYLSVHSNSFKTEAAKGTTILYYGASEEDGNFSSKTFAEILQKELVSALGTYDRGLTDGSEMYVIRKTTMPSVIAEMAFISNPDDRKILASDEYRKRAAYAMARAVIISLNQMAAEN